MRVLVLLRVRVRVCVRVCMCVCEKIPENRVGEEKKEKIF